ncbi:YbdD/YjiX family protein [Streptomyces sp. 4N509B]|uniref:YbdD/YjiX family protein n=1 Tax=Streptomyces sp. 4N509B TaxID=3457413 RepID=UPI003FD5167A
MRVIRRRSTSGSADGSAALPASGPVGGPACAATSGPSGPSGNPVARLWWYVREFTGETAYERYTERLRREDPAAPVPTRREFERWRTEERYGGGDPAKKYYRGCC